MLDNLWLGFRSVTMTVLFPGMVAGVVPYYILSPISVPGPAAWSVSQFVAAALIVAGLAVLLWCIWVFAHHGRGTLAPFDEPRKLVVGGPYRFVRNPMYVGIMAILHGECWFFWSGQLLLYTMLVFTAFNIFVIGFEELRLRSKYGSDYERYCSAVRRWIPGRAYRDSILPAMSSPDQ